MGALGATAGLEVMWGGRGEVDRLLDGDHARLMRAWAMCQQEAGWEVWTEASYSIYGERGRVDQLAYHPLTGCVSVTEGKTGIWDVQELLGRLDTKVRLAPRIAAQRGWRVERVVGVLVIADGRTARRRVAEYGELFAGYEVRGAAVRAWLRAPQRPATGLLAFISLPRSTQDGLRRAGQRRVRVSTNSASADPAQSPPASAARLA